MLFYVMLALFQQTRKQDLRNNKAKEQRKESNKDTQKLKKGKDRNKEKKQDNK